MFDLKRPCVNCPFRRGQGSLFRLHPARLAEIKAATAFQCHKTVEFDEECQIDEEHWDDQWRPIKEDSRAQQCAGLMAVLTREKRPNQIMQVAQRLGAFNPDDLDPKNDAYASWAEVCAAHQGSEP